MRVSYRWLQRHVDVGARTAEEAARDLTLHVCEVEGVERFAPWLDELVVGHVVERDRHPAADKLSLCRVDAGDGEPLPVVCGAPNVAAGQKVALARVGARLPNDVKIKKSKIRGVESQGMICSEKELALGEDHDGIWVLPAEAPVGRPVSEAVDAVDWVLEVDNKAITHRPDLWGHRGLAAELASLWRTELLPLDVSLPPTGDGEAFPVRVESPSCSRYLALAVDGVRAERSPDWLRMLLFAVGQRPLDLLVDVSNFVMLDLGQPNHIFDRRRISPEGIVVRDARRGETLRTLDGEARRLGPSDLLVCSGDEPVALAGIMGGEGSKVGPDTSELLLEVAAFHPVVVRRTATRIGLRTDASARFEKSLDPTLPLRAAGHLVRLLAAIQPDLRLPAPATDAGDWRDPSRTLTLRPERVRALLGLVIPDGEIAEILERLSFGVRVAGDSLEVDVPSWRATKDVTIEEDLIEEVGRVVGYDRIPSRPLRAALEPVAPGRRRDLVRRIQDRLAGAARFHEAMTYSFVSDDLVQAVRADELPHVEVSNAVAEGFARVRRSVVPSLLDRLPANLRQREEVRLFEIGKGTRPETTDERGKPREVHELGVVWAAPRPDGNARFDADRLSHLRGVVDDVLSALDVPPVSWSLPAVVPGWAHPGRALASQIEGAGEPVALLAALEPGVARTLGIDGDVAAGVVSIDALVGLAPTRAPFRPLPRFPGVKIDVALAVDRSLPAADLEVAIRRAGKGLVARVELFDLYRGEALGEGRKSLAYHVLLQAPDRTLSDGDGQKFLGRLERQVRELGGELRKE